MGEDNVVTKWRQGERDFLVEKLKEKDAEIARLQAGLREVIEKECLQGEAYKHIRALTDETGGKVEL